MGQITRRKTIALGLATASGLMLGAAGRVFSAGIDQTVPAPPPDRPNAGTRDMTAHFAALTARVPVDNAFRTAFMKRKVRTAYTHPSFDIASRNQSVQQVIERFGPAAYDLLTQPTPGGVGYGVFYTPEFKTAWGSGTSIYFNVVCPNPPEGNVDTFLYLTATNRAGLGVEAFVSYYGQNDTRFKVFDWAQTFPWQTDISLSQLEDYLRPDSSSNNAPQQLSIWNSTWNIGGKFYRNQVQLYNHARHGWDLVYQYDYAATDEQQKTGWIGSWSPIVETFQPAYSQTNPMGATGTLLMSADQYGRWGKWARLGATDSYVRTDNQGFSLRYVAPNFAFIVIS